jgi:HSP20 family protein
MRIRKEAGLVPRQLAALDPFGMLRQMTADVDRMFEEPLWSFRRPLLRRFGAAEPAPWYPNVDVFERENRLVTKIDLPGMKKEDVKIEVADGQLAISGERKREEDEKKDNFYRCEREYGSFYRLVALPPGVTLDDVKATFADGVLEVSIPLPAAPAPKVRQVEITAPEPGVKTAA